MRQQPFASPEEALEHIQNEVLVQQLVLSEEIAQRTEEFLEHFGVKGMRWGVRKERVRDLQQLVDKDIVRTTKNGDEFRLSPKPPNVIDKTLAFSSQKYADKYKGSAFVSIKDKNGKKIGTGAFWYDKKDPQSVYLNWITIDKSARGRGYASAVLKASEDHARAAGKTKMKLEVPGNAPDARHIYTKMGFKVIKEPTASEAKNDPVWGGLTEMEKKLD